MCWLASFLASVFVALHCMTKSPCCICNAYLCLVGCGHRESSRLCFFFLIFHTHLSTFQLLDKPWPQVSSLSPPRLMPSIFIAHRVQQPQCSSIFHRVLLTHALVLSASEFVNKKKSPRIYTSMHSGGFELRKLICTRLEDTTSYATGATGFVRGIGADTACAGYRRAKTS